MKRDYFRELRDAKGSEDAMEHIMEEAAKARIRCPLLDSNDQCVLYDYRPITCRLYGIPTAIGGKGHVCGQSNFAAGASYPTVHLDKIQERLDRLSVEIRDRVQSRFKELHEVFVPVSMALLTNYDDAYLGIGRRPRSLDDFRHHVSRQHQAGADRGAGTAQARNYERMNPRRRKFIDRIGYDEWDPFQKPNDPMDIRVDPSKRTTQQLFRGSCIRSANAPRAMTSTKALSTARSGL